MYDGKIKKNSYINCDSGGKSGMEKFKYSKIFLLGFGFFGISVLWALYNAYVPIFLKDFALSYLVIGFIMTIDNIFAIVMLPYIGALSDQTRTKIGRRMPYIITGAPLGAFFFALIPVARNMHSLFFMMATIIIMNFAMAFFRSPVIALMPDITPSKYRSQANGIINFMGGLGALLVYFVGKPLYDRNFALPFYLGALILLLSSILVVVFIKEPEIYRRKEISMKKEKLIRRSTGELLENLKDVFAAKEKSLLYMLLSILFWFIAFNAIETFFTSYAKFEIGIKESTGALILGFFSLAFMIFSIPAGFIGSKIGRRRTMTLGLIAIIIIVILTLILGIRVSTLPEGSELELARSKFVKTLFLLFSIGGMGWAMVNVNSLPTIVDMTENKKVGGYTGLYYFFSMAANIFAPPLAGFLIDIFGYNSLMVLSAVFFFLSIITLRFVKKGDVK